jgi:NAD(P)-dependent dehydrogenase (short-subunit alcohol dehydrogenase family)
MSNPSLAGRTVVITGAGAGIGRACALAFRDDGAHVIGADVVPERMESLRAEGISTIVADCSRDADMRAMVQRAIDETGRIDVLFSNAGYGLGRRVEDFRDGEYEQLLAVHVFGALYAMRAAIPHMRQQKFGRIITTLSRAGEGARAGGSAYASAKACLWSLMRCTALEVADDNILVNGLIPGQTDTSIRSVRRPELQPPEAVYPTVRMLATLEAGGPRGKVFYWEREYPFFHAAAPRDVDLGYWRERERSEVAARRAATTGH